VTCVPPSAVRAFIRTCGTGVYQNIKGQNTEYRIGVNGTGLFNLSFTFTH